MEKLPTHTGDTQDPSNGSRPARRSRPCPAVFWRRLLIVLCLLAGYCFVIRNPSIKISSIFAPCHRHMSGESSTEDSDVSSLSQEVKASGHDLSDASRKVPFEAHIMSKCPDAQACIRELVIPTMEQVYDKVDFQLSFIASVSKESHEIECMHGPGECIGNMLMLCAANLPFPPTNDLSLLPQSYPRTPIVRSLGFANCLTTEYQRIPDREFIQQCALEHGIDFDALNSCASQQDDDDGEIPHKAVPLSGLALLRQSALRGEQLGIKTSCTVRVDEKVWCIHDNNEWRDCAKDGDNPQVLAEEINKLWEAKNSDS